MSDSASSTTDSPISETTVKTYVKAVDGIQPLLSTMVERALSAQRFVKRTHWAKRALIAVLYFFNGALVAYVVSGLGESTILWSLLLFLEPTMAVLTLRIIQGLCILLILIFYQVVNRITNWILHRNKELWVSFGAVSLAILGLYLWEDRNAENPLQEEKEETIIDAVEFVAEVFSVVIEMPKFSSFSYELTSFGEGLERVPKIMWLSDPGSLERKSVPILIGRAAVAFDKADVRTLWKIRNELGQIRQDIVLPPFSQSLVMTIFKEYPATIPLLVFLVTLALKIFGFW